jgi:hypothetical protein
MKLINLVYEYDYDDVDIVSVPDHVCDNIDRVVQEFNDWTGNTRDHGWFVIDDKGKEVLATGTKEFVKWLNDNYFRYENKEIVVVKAHTKYNPKYPTADF